ncbi:2-polyprenyl-6-methoxyphenol hydroxylase-like FAD-dependent oxidoreductase [Allocatelliglobosispora scoriae]|uniref:2-polyprenyl-6-methoxyphenol hydroxylase-like FAD-dependent oxidoreductase n=1 Tax=Allocatelliglobosispora scoriae TaxID=643052 RepID=A0A841C158_9ACTN|nr:FAD-binding protein [Allocatelliglobosispora scoriae]MBB5872792.1 2-polyprenyl-6-methoxyphenol hydroxylase-like FAD-dependent oxidoreductase [Allocatelliglobosispora scoriae]
MSANGKAGHAVVLGASIGGLLAARVLSESFAKVTIFDRDELPTTGLDRKGVPQGEHSHGLLARGRQVLEELFDGFADDLAALGALAIDIQNDCVWINDGHRIPRVASDLRGLCVSRPTLEGYIRTRVTALPNVEIAPRHEALGLLTSDDRSAVTGVRVMTVGTTEEREVAAELVVDATGRGNRGPTWLAEIGYDKPAEVLVNPGTVYMSRDYKRVDGDADFAAAIMSPSPESPRGGVMIAADGDRWMVTLIGVNGVVPPSDPEGFLEFTRTLHGTEIYDVLSKAEPLCEPKKMRLPTSVRRRYEDAVRLPDGFIAFADAICSFNPAYGQGMTVAAAEAIVLRDALAKGREGMPKRFFAEAAKVIDVPWDIAVGADLRYPNVQGERTGKVKFLNNYVGKLHIAAEKHAVVGHRFLSVANLMAPPTDLFAPGIVTRVLWSGRRKKADQTA